MAQATEKNQDDEKINILSLFPKFELQLPFFNRPKVVEEKSKTTIVNGSQNSEIENIKRNFNFAKFPDSTGRIIPPPFVFEAEEPAGKTSNPVVLYQVYALGGFLVLRWIWARWKERKERATKDSANDNESPATDDDDYHSA